jgi:hypothetical protein
MAHHLLPDDFQPGENDGASSHDVKNVQPMLRILVRGKFISFFLSHLFFFTQKSFAAEEKSVTTILGMSAFEFIF